MKNCMNIIILINILLMGACHDAKVQKQPNVLFILADDLGYTDLSCMGSAFYETPNIDKIATDGMMFTQGYCSLQCMQPFKSKYNNR